MSPNSLLLILAGGVLIVFVIYRQFGQRQAGDWRRTVIIPVVLVGWGVLNLTHIASFGAVEVVVIAIRLVLGILLGFARGFATRIWRDDSGVVWQKGTVALLILWLLSVGVRLGLGVVGGFLGINQVTSLSEIPLFFGATLAAQNTVVLVRLQAG
jgi:hypothetical protein